MKGYQIPFKKNMIQGGAIVLAALVLGIFMVCTVKTLKSYDDMKSLAAYLQKQNSVELFVQYAEKNGLKRRNLLIQKSHKLLERYVNSRIIYNMLSEQAWTEYLNTDDPVISATLKLFKEKKAFPKNTDDKKELQKVAMSYDYRGTHSKAMLIAHA